MTGAVMLSDGPQTVPALSGPLPADIPPDVDMDQVIAQVGADGVCAPPQDVAGLREVVKQAHDKGIDLKIVVINRNPRIDTPLRDIATEVGHAYPGSTVLAMSPSYAGVYSPSFDRVTLEAGQDLAKTGNYVQSSQNFLHELTAPEFPWTAMTILIVIGVALAAVATRILQVRSKRAVSANVAATDD